MRTGTIVITDSLARYFVANYIFFFFFDLITLRASWFAGILQLFAAIDCIRALQECELRLSLECIHRHRCMFGVIQVTLIVISQTLFLSLNVSCVFFCVFFSLFINWGEVENATWASRGYTRTTRRNLRWSALSAKAFRKAPLLLRQCRGQTRQISQRVSGRPPADTGLLRRPLGRVFQALECNGSLTSGHQNGGDWENPSSTVFFLAPRHMRTETCFNTVSDSNVYSTGTALTRSLTFRRLILSRFIAPDRSERFSACEHFVPILPRKKKMERKDAATDGSQVFTKLSKLFESF